MSILILHADQFLYVIGQCLQRLAALRQELMPDVNFDDRAGRAGADHATRVVQYLVDYLDRVP